jgi:hypothetical protein
MDYITAVAEAAVFLLYQIFRPISIVYCSWRSQPALKPSSVRGRRPYVGRVHTLPRVDNPIIELHGSEGRGMDPSL